MSFYGPLGGGVRLLHDFETPEIIDTPRPHAIFFERSLSLYLGASREKFYDTISFLLDAPLSTLDPVCNEEICWLRSGTYLSLSFASSHIQGMEHTVLVVACMSSFDIGRLI